MFSLISWPLGKLIAHLHASIGHGRLWSALQIILASTGAVDALIIFRELQLGSIGQHYFRNVSFPSCVCLSVCVQARMHVRLEASLIL